MSAAIAVLMIAVAISYRQICLAYPTGGRSYSVESPFRALVGPLTAYLDALDLAWPPDRDAPVTDRPPPRVRGSALVGSSAV